MELAPRVPQGDLLAGAGHPVASFHIGNYEVKALAVFDIICITLKAHHMSNHGAVRGWPQDAFDPYAYAFAHLYSTVTLVRVHRGGRGLPRCE